MQLKKLDYSYYRDNTAIVNALDNYDGKWQAGKIRGYGIVIVSINNLKFAIPLRSNIKHNASYITKKKSHSNPHNKGLDYSKTLLIEDNRYITDATFVIPDEEHKKLKNKSYFITARLTKYIDKYIKAVSRKDNNILGSKEYRYTTLINYHSQLGI